MKEVGIFVICLFTLCSIVVGQRTQVAYHYDNPPLIAGSFTQTIYTATLTSDQIVPEPLFLGGWGTSFCELRRDLSTEDEQVLYCHVCHNIKIVGRATISLGERLINGPELYQFTVPLENYFEELIYLSDKPNYPLFSQIQDFLNGRWYLTVYSIEEGHHIRGQLEQTDNIYALMADELTFPPAFGAPHRGITLGTFTHSNPKRQANFDLCHDVEGAVYAEIGRGVPGYPGEFVFNFRNVVPPITAEFDYTINEEHELITGYQFAQVVSEDNPQGAIRGQLSWVDPIPFVTVTSRLDGNQLGDELSSARGCALITYECNTRRMEWMIFHTVSQPTSLLVRAAPPGFSGPILFSVTGSNALRSPIFGSRILNAEEEWVLYAQQMYFQINSVNFPNGEIRGQLTTQFDFFAFITGVQMVPPVTTANMGCATFNLRDLNFNVDFEIFHSVDDVIAVDFYQGALNGPGKLLSQRHLAGYSEFDSPDSPLIGNFNIDDDDQAAFITRNSFIQISSKRYPHGEIRGQIVRINPCDPDPLDFSKSTATASFANTVNSYILLPIGNDSPSLYHNYFFLFTCLVLIFFILI